jgi:chromosome segregation ATPase
MKELEQLTEIGLEQALAELQRVRDDLKFCRREVEHLLHSRQHYHGVIERLRAELAAATEREKTYAQAWDAAGRLPPSRFAHDEQLRTSDNLGQGESEGTA